MCTKCTLSKSFVVDSDNLCDRIQSHAKIQSNPSVTLDGTLNKNKYRAKM